MEKTILEWLKEIPDAEVREKALRNHADCLESYNNTELFPSLSEAIWSAFRWNDTSEGTLFWSDWAEGKSPSLPQDPTTPSSEELLKEEIERLRFQLKAADSDHEQLQAELDKARADKSAAVLLTTTQSLIDWLEEKQFRSVEISMVRNAIADYKSNQ